MADNRQEPSQIGPWLIQKRIGQGGFGAVFSVRHLERREIVRALKWIPIPDPETVSRLQREAELLARVQHPGVVRIFEVGQHGQGAYIVMELIQGRSLRALIENAPGGLELSQAFFLMNGIAEAVGAAHALGISHRDLKPENILVDEHGAPRVIDFGLALASDVEKLTRTGGSMGTLGYMAPEQMDGRRAAQGPPTDVFALGAIFFELLTGRSVFKGTQGAMMMQIASGVVSSASADREDLPDGTDGFLARCLDHHPRNRFRDARDFAKGLGELRSGALAAKNRAAARRRSVVVVASVGLALALGAGAFKAFSVQWQIADESLAQLQNDTLGLSSSKATRPTVTALLKRHEELLASRWLRTANHGDELALLAKQLHRLDLVSQLQESATAREAATLLLTSEADAAITSLAWEGFKRTLPEPAADRITALNALLVRGKTSSTTEAKRLCVQALVAAAAKVDKTTCEKALAYAVQNSPAEYATEAASWMSGAFPTRAAREEAMRYGAALDASFPEHAGTVEEHRQIKRALANLLVAHLGDLAHSDGPAAIEERTLAYRLDPGIPAPAWYIGWLERVAYNDSFAREIVGRDAAQIPALQTAAFLELVAEDGTWGLDGADRVALRLTPRFQPSHMHNESDAQLLKASLLFASHPYPLIENEKTSVGGHEYWTTVSWRYRDLARCFARRALEVRPQLPPVGRLTAVARAFELTSRLLGELWIYGDGSGWQPGMWGPNLRTANELLLEIESLQETALEAAALAVKQSPDDDDVKRSCQIAKLRRAAGLELWGQFYIVVSLRGPPGTVDPTPAEVAQKTLEKLKEAYRLDVEAGAPDFRLLEVQNLIVWAAAASGDNRFALEECDRALQSVIGQRVALHPEGDLVSSGELFKLHHEAGIAALGLTPPDMKRARSEREACETLIHQEIAVDSEMKDLQEMLAGLDQQIESKSPR